MRVKIDNQEVLFFTSGSISLRLDSIASTFSFQSHFSANNEEHQILFKPLQYKKVEIFNSKDVLLLTGTILNHEFISNSGRNLVTIAGYSKSGILEDVPIPVKSYPLESSGRSLREIANRLCGFYDIKVVVDDSGKRLTNEPLGKEKKIFFSDRTVFEKLKSKVNQIFGRTSASPTESIKDYLAKLCSQKNIILSHNEKGDVVLFAPDYNQKPRFFFTKGNTLEMKSNFNGQGLHSEINVVRQPSDENSGVATTDKAYNNLIPIYRPTTKVLNSGDDVDVQNSAKNEMAAELQNIGISLKLQGNSNFETIRPGEIVNVHNHYIYAYAYNRYMVQQITFEFDEKQNVTTIDLLVPEAFTGGNIRNILFNHLDQDNHMEPHLNEENSIYTNRKDIL